MSDLDDLIADIEYQRKKDKFEREMEEAKRLQRYNERMQSSGCLIVGLLTAFTVLSGIAAAKTISNAIDTKQPEGPKATLVSKSSVQKPKNLDTEHTKD